MNNASVSASLSPGMILPNQSAKSHTNEDPITCGKWIREIGNTLYEITARVSIFALAAFVAWYFVSPLAGTFLTFSVVSIATRLGIKITDLEDPKYFDNFKKKLREFTEPVQLITFVASLSLSFFWPMGGRLIAAGWGIMNGTVVDKSAPADFPNTDQVNLDYVPVPPLERIANA